MDELLSLAKAISTLSGYYAEHACEMSIKEIVVCLRAIEKHADDIVLSYEGGEQCSLE